MHSRNREELAVRCLLPLWVLAGLKAAGAESRKHRYSRGGEVKDYLKKNIKKQP